LIGPRTSEQCRPVSNRFQPPGDGEPGKSIRAALYERTPPALRTALHAQVARALAATGAPAELVAEHVLAGGECGDWVAGWLADGTGTALVHRAPRVAVELFDRVLDRLPADRPTTRFPTYRRDPRGTHLHEARRPVPGGGRP